ncbi:hypothetical protein Tco_0727684 [Tanacetum coccineum]|uniref:Secreted protein n=1 Tax=Tanacetum coccineum TaxID=301880 RepID=A0ABQ4YJ21_9ASTR
MRAKLVGPYFAWLFVPTVLIPGCPALPCKVSFFVAVETLYLRLVIPNSFFVGHVQLPSSILCWELNTSELVLPRMISTQSQTSYYCWFKITAVGEKVNDTGSKESNQAKNADRVLSELCFKKLRSRRYIQKNSIFDKEEDGSNALQTLRRSLLINGAQASGEARVQQRKRRIQRRVQQKQKDQEDEVLGRILSARNEG